MLGKKIILTSLLAFGVSSTAFASLTIVNNTNHDSTSVINNGYCSTTVLGNEGITKAHTSKVINDLKIKLACAKDMENCKADVYMTNNCTGDVITTVTFSTSGGLKSATPPRNGYVIAFDGPFAVRLEGGPAAH